MSSWRDGQVPVKASSHACTVLLPAAEQLFEKGGLKGVDLDDSLPPYHLLNKKFRFYTVSIAFSVGWTFLE